MCVCVCVASVGQEFDIRWWPGPILMIRIRFKGETKAGYTLSTDQRPVYNPVIIHPSRQHSGHLRTNLWLGPRIKTKLRVFRDLEPIWILILLKVHYPWMCFLRVNIPPKGNLNWVVEVCSPSVFSLVRICHLISVMSWDLIAWTVNKWNCLFCSKHQLHLLLFLVL